MTSKVSPLSSWEKFVAIAEFSKQLSLGVPVMLFKFLLEEVLRIYALFEKKTQEQGNSKRV